MDPQTIRSLFDTLGFRLVDITLNPAIVFVVVGATYWVRRLATRTLLPARWERWESLMDGLLCWIAPGAIAAFAIHALNGIKTWEGLAANAFLYAAVSSMAYGLFAKALMEKAWGPANGKEEVPRG